jgi:hypothetical protein
VQAGGVLSPTTSGQVRSSQVEAGGVLGVADDVSVKGGGGGDVTTGPRKAEEVEGGEHEPN